MDLDRDALRQKLEDARYRVEGVFGGMDPEKRKFVIRLGIMGSILIVLVLVGTIFVWGGGGGGSFERAVVASAETRTLADTVSERLAGKPQFSEILISAVAVSGDDTEQLMISGGVPSIEALEELRSTIEKETPGVQLTWRVAVVRPSDRLEPEGG